MEPDIPFPNSIYNPADSSSWQDMSAIKSNILKRETHAPAGIKVCCIKFIQRIVQAQTPGLIADPRVRSLASQSSQPAFPLTRACSDLIRMNCPWPLYLLSMPSSLRRTCKLRRQVSSIVCSMSFTTHLPGMPPSVEVHVSSIILTKLATHSSSRQHSTVLQYWSGLELL